MVIPQKNQESSVFLLESSDSDLQGGLPVRSKIEAKWDQSHMKH